MRRLKAFARMSELIHLSDITDRVVQRFDGVVGSAVEAGGRHAEGGGRSGRGAGVAAGADEVRSGSARVGRRGGQIREAVLYRLLFKSS